MPKAEQPEAAKRLRVIWPAEREKATWELAGELIDGSSVVALVGIAAVAIVAIVRTVLGARVRPSGGPDGGNSVAGDHGGGLTIRPTPANSPAIW